MARLKMMGSRLGAPEARVKPMPKTAESFYLSGAWRGLVARIKRERGSYCCLCGSNDRVIADHIVERKDGGAELDPRNVQLLCHAHHQRKTADARRARAMGRAPR